MEMSHQEAIYTPCIYIHLRVATYTPYPIVTLTFIRLLEYVDSRHDCTLSLLTLAVHRTVPS